MRRVDTRHISVELTDRHRAEVLSICVLLGIDFAHVSLNPGPTFSYTEIKIVDTDG